MRGLLTLSLLEVKSPAKQKSVCTVNNAYRSNCDPNGIRTRATAVRGRRTRPLYDGAALPESSGLRFPDREFRWGTRTRTYDDGTRGRWVADYTLPHGFVAPSATRDNFTLIRSVVKMQGVNVHNVTQ